MVILVANRGEIARRVFRTADEWGVRTVAVYADPDIDAAHVHDAASAERIGPAALTDSYLSIDALLDAAQRSNATHLHPGYGFLSERTDFAEAVVNAGLTWIGPSPTSVASMGSKIEARNVATSAGVPVIPGFNESQDPATLQRAAEEIGYPILVKASAGGGGKGIRIALMPDDFEAALRDAKDEAMRSFGDDDVIVERYITRPRHIEIQIAADKHGTVVDLGTRECSVQRRYQKVLEEAPAPNLPDDVESAMRAAAVKISETIGYDSVGTVEFIVDASTNDFFFLEMNTRIQVEHTVTEEVTGIDLIALQIAVASGAPMPISRSAFDDALATRPQHAFEARITAEDAWNGHVPQTGVIERLEVPDGPQIRWDAAIVQGSEIGTHYDSMIGKLIVSASSRLEALDGLQDALEGLEIVGLTTNIDFHRWLVAQPEMRAARITTRYLDETPLPRHSPFGDVGPTSPWNTRFGRRITPHRSGFIFDSPSRDDRWHGNERTGDAGTHVVSPFPGLITEVHVGVGDQVAAGQTLLTIEAMKMLHPITASGPTTIASIDVARGDQVESHATLITFSPPEQP
jgi:acetyl/propionyl-CoA carboxylase alpha subunit